MYKYATIKIKTVLSLLFFLTFIISFPVEAKAEGTKKYVAAGIPFGISLETDGVLVTGYVGADSMSKGDNPALKSGIKPGDVITSVENKKIYAATELTKIINESKGKSVKIMLNRCNNEMTFSITPQRCEDGIYRLGINVRDSIAGIGTVTYIDPETGEFGGLGHGICDVNTVVPIPMRQGSVTSVQINNIIKGQAGIPGEIRGSFSIKRIGTANSNKESGVYGILSMRNFNKDLMLEAAEEKEITCGNAEILCTLGNDGPKRYSITIEHIDLNKNTKTRNYIVKVTDGELLTRTGGIIQGMSGSPIIQNGKIIGAITHVLVNDPTRGYGIFIGNMIDG